MDYISFLVTQYLRASNLRQRGADAKILAAWIYLDFEHLIVNNKTSVVSYIFTDNPATFLRICQKDDQISNVRRLACPKIR